MSIDNKLLEAPVTFGDNSSDQPSNINMPSQAKMGYLSGQPTNGYFFSPQAQERVLEYEAKKCIDIQAQGALLEQRRWYDMRLLEKKEEIAKRRDESIYKRKCDRELAVWSAFENGDGHICMQMALPDGEIVYSPPVFDRKYFKLVIIVSEETGKEIPVLTWENEGYRIFTDGFNKKEMLKGLEQSGIKISVGRDRKAFFIETIITFLYSKAERIVVPDHIGWNKKEGRWHFVKPDEMSFEVVSRRGHNG